MAYISDHQKIYYIYDRLKNLKPVLSLSKDIGLTVIDSSSKAVDINITPVIKISTMSVNNSDLY